MRTELENWQKECEAFQLWFANLGGNISSNEQMSEAFMRIKGKNLSDKNLFNVIDTEWINNIEVVDYEIL